MYFPNFMGNRGRSLFCRRAAGIMGLAPKIEEEGQKFIKKNGNFLCWVIPLEAVSYTHLNRDIEAGLYQETGVEAFKQALAEAKALDKYAPQAQIQAAALKLNEAMANLRLKSVSNAIMRCV